MKPSEKNTTFNFIIRDDDLNFFSTPEDIIGAYNQVFQQGIPVSFATIPFVTPKSDLHISIQAPNGEYAISGNTELVEYIKNNSLIEIMQHGCNHEIKQGVFEYMQNTGLFEDTVRGKAELEKAFDRPVTVFVAPHDQFSRHGILAIENAGLNIIRGKGSKNFLLRPAYVKAIIKMIIHKTTSPFAFPDVIDLGGHQEAFGNRIEFGRDYLFKALRYAYETGGNFILVNHIHDFNNDKNRLMLELIAEAKKLGATFVRAGELF